MEDFDYTFVKETVDDEQGKEEGEGEQEEEQDAEPEEVKEEAEEEPQPDDDEGEEEHREVVKPKKGGKAKKLTNQFNFSERAALTYNNPVRVRLIYA